MQRLASLASTSCASPYLLLLQWFLLLLSSCRSPLQLRVHHHFIHLLTQLWQVLARCRVAAVGAVPLREVLEPSAAATHAAGEAAV
jgi:hypothetical protein